MKLTKKQRWSVLGALLAATLAVRAVSSSEDDSTAVVQSVARSTAGIADASGKPRQIATLDLSKINRDPNESVLVDIFTPKSWYTPPPAPPQPAVATQPPAPVVPAIPFNYVGQLGEIDGKVTAYLAKADTVYTARVGDIVDEKYRLDAINETQLTFTYLPMQKQQVLPVPPK